MLSANDCCGPTKVWFGNMIPHMFGLVPPQFGDVVSPRFGDQILQMDGVSLAGFSSEKVFLLAQKLYGFLIMTAVLTIDDDLTLG